MLDSPGAGGLAVRGTALRTAGFAATTVLGLISAPILTRHLGVEDFGRYATISALVALVVVVTDVGLGTYGMRELAVREPAEQRALLRRIIGLRLVLSLVGFAGAVAFAALAGYGSALVLGTVLASVGALTYVTQGMLALPLGVRLRLGWITVGEVVRQVVFVVAIVVLVLAGAGVVPLLAAAIPAGLVGTALLAWASRGALVWRPAFDGRGWLRLLRETLPVAVSGVVYTIYFRVVILIMSVIATASETGEFALSYRVIEILMTLPFLALGATLPLLSRAADTDQDRLRFAFARSFDVSVVAGIGLAVLTFTGAPLAMNVLTGSDTGPPVAVLEIQSPALATAFVSVIYGTVLLALRRHRELVLVSGIALVVTVVATFVLVPVSGAKGGGVATLIGEAVLALASVIVLRRVRPDLHPHHRVLPLAVLAAGLAVLASRVLEIPYVPNVGAVAVAGLVYLAVLLATRAIPAELIDALRPQARRA